MAHIAQDSLATIYFSFTWKSSHATHVEHYFAKDVDLTRDILPLGVKSRILGLGEGDSVELIADPSEVPLFKPGKVLDMPIVRFQPPQINDRTITPRIGRYYPKNFIDQVPGTRPDSVTPFRVVERDRASFKADLNHPMAGREVTIKATVMEVNAPSTEAGTLKRWTNIFYQGPGMQARLPETPTDYLGDDPFQRKNESGDAEFYAAPHKARHLDEQASTCVQNLYGDLLEDGMDILDLMTGDMSHLPDALKPNSVTGLGLNQEAIDANAALTERIVHNLNEAPELPFEKDSFHAIICTVSVEYLTKPFEIFQEAARVLKPGGVFVLTFSNRWFDDKVVRIWPELTEFERMGLVSQFFVREEKFNDLNTLSERGWPQTEDSKDNNSEDLGQSDPIYAVWGRRK